MFALKVSDTYIKYCLFKVSAGLIDTNHDHAKSKDYFSCWLIRKSMKAYTRWKTSSSLESLYCIQVKPTFKMKTDPVFIVIALNDIWNNILSTQHNPNITTKPSNTVICTFNLIFHFILNVLVHGPQPGWGQNNGEQLKSPMWTSGQMGLWQRLTLY